MGTDAQGLNPSTRPTFEEWWREQKGTDDQGRTRMVGQIRDSEGNIVGSAYGHSRREIFEQLISLGGQDPWEVRVYKTPHEPHTATPPLIPRCFEVYEGEEIMQALEEKFFSSTRGGTLNMNMAWLDLKAWARDIVEKVRRAEAKEVEFAVDLAQTVRKVERLRRTLGDAKRILGAPNHLELLPFCGEIKAALLRSEQRALDLAIILANIEKADKKAP